jgi:hypothetical protein
MTPIVMSALEFMQRLAAVVAAGRAGIVTTACWKAGNGKV